jgi:hypothetical protein
VIKTGFASPVIMNSKMYVYVGGTTVVDDPGLVGVVTGVVGVEPTGSVVLTDTGGV